MVRTCKVVHDIGQQVEVCRWLCPLLGHCLEGPASTADVFDNRLASIRKPLLHAPPLYIGRSRLAACLMFIRALAHLLFPALARDNVPVPS